MLPVQRWWWRRQELRHAWRATGPCSLSHAHAHEPWCAGLIADPPNRTLLVGGKGDKKSGRAHGTRGCAAACMAAALLSNTCVEWRIMRGISACNGVRPGVAAQVVPQTAGQQQQHQCASRSASARQAAGSSYCWATAAVEVLPSASFKFQ